VKGCKKSVIVFSGLTWAASDVEGLGPSFQTVSGLAPLGLFLIPVISAVVGYVASKISMTSNGGTLAPEAAKHKQDDDAVEPLISLWIRLRHAGALGLYWIASLFLPQSRNSYSAKYFQNSLDAEDEERRARIRHVKKNLSANALKL
jgi:membrane protein insertase Oxa1/YidC/SpoIIIJ